MNETIMPVNELLEADDEKLTCFRDIIVVNCMRVIIVIVNIAHGVVNGTRILINFVVGEQIRAIKNTTWK